MLVKVGGVGVVPVLFKLLPEDTFWCEFILKEKKQVINNENKGEEKKVYISALFCVPKLYQYS